MPHSFSFSSLLPHSLLVFFLTGQGRAPPGHPEGKGGEGRPLNGPEPQRLAMSDAKKKERKKEDKSGGRVKERHNYRAEGRRLRNEGEEETREVGGASNFGCGFRTTLFQRGLVLFLPQLRRKNKENSQKPENPFKERNKFGKNCTNAPGIHEIGGELLHTSTVKLQNLTNESSKKQSCRTTRMPRKCGEKKESREPGTGNPTGGGTVDLQNDTKQSH